MSRRIERINYLLRAEISHLLRESKDPRLDHFITVTEVSTSPDLHHAKVFVSIMENTEEKASVLAGLASAAGFFRRELRARLDMRYIPELHFQQDNSLEQGAHLAELIHQLSPSTDQQSA